MNKTIILVEDDRFTRNFLREKIEESGNICMDYKDEEGCLEGIKNGLKFDLLIMDLSERENEPLDIIKYKARVGLDLGCKIKALFPNIPIITISGYNFKQPYANCHITKPAESRIYLEKIRDFLG